ncbi:MAG: hypothetical protein KA175_12495, partial [Flavobacteriales bacterium]|nr:hypothetical protein [Flavobacteriales bacterium]
FLSMTRNAPADFIPFSRLYDNFLGACRVEGAMNNTEKRAFWSDRSKLIAMGALLLMLLSFGITLYEHGQHADLGTAMDLQRSQVQRLQHEREKLAGQLSGTAQGLRAAQQNAATLTEQRDQAERKADEAQARMVQGAAEQANAAKWRKEAEALRASNAQLQQQVVGSQASIDRLNTENRTLGERNASLRTEMEQMAANQARMDNSLAQAFQGKRERLTVLAKRTRKLQVSLDLPTALAKEASYIITRPDGKVVKGDDPSVSVITSKLPGAALASGGKGATPGADQVKLVYIPKERLKPGVYKVNVRSGEQSIGTTYISLR